MIHVVKEACKQWTHLGIAWMSGHQLDGRMAPAGATGIYMHQCVVFENLKCIYSTFQNLYCTFNEAAGGLGVDIAADS